MNILFIINAFSIGGAEKLVCNLALQLRSMVQGISVIGLYQANPQVQENLRQKLEENGIKTYVLNKRAGKDRVNSVRQICHIIKKDKISVLHGHCSVPMLLGKIAGFLTHTPVVCTVHNTRNYSAIRELLTSWMSAAYVSIGTAAEQYMLAELHISPHKICRIDNAVNVQYLQNSKKIATFWQQYGGTEGDVNLINIGRVHPQKNQLCMLRAMKELKEQGCTNYQLYIIGPYSQTDALYQKLMLFTQTNHLEKQVHFLGLTTHVADFIANADCFLMTSHYEGLSLAFLEAVIGGLPVISTDLPFVRNLRKIAPCALLIGQNDSHALAEMLKNKEFLKFTAPKELFAKHFSIENCAQRHLELYQQVSI